MALLLLLRDISVALYDWAMGERRRRYEHAIDIAAPRDTVWALLRARDVSFGGVFPVRILTEPLAGRPDLLRLRIFAGESTIAMMTRLVDERPGQAILFEVLADGTDAVLVDGEEDFIGYVVMERGSGTRLTITRELTVTSRFGRITVPLGIRAGALRAKRKAEEIARGEAPIPETV